MELWTAFLIGLGSSLHCIGMCGPLAAALPGYKRSNLPFLAGRLLYNSGRVVTYAGLGGLFGLVGHQIKMAGWQQTLSIVLGALIVLAALTPLGLRQKLLNTPPLIAALHRIKAALARLFQHPSPAGLFPIGLLNGLLPCGMVYLALAGAVATGSPLGGMAFMAAFGLGTLPLMLAAGLAGKLFKLPARRFARRLLPVGALMVGGLLILRGLALDIPFLSPPPPDSPAAMHAHH